MPYFGIPCTQSHLPHAPPMSTIDVVDSGQSEVHHVDVERAEQAFADLARSLSRRSYNQGVQHTGDPDATVHATPASTINHDSKDIEKGDNTESTQFDLREYLTSSNDKNQEAGIYHKHVGVTWDDLQVEGIGGLDNKFYVKTFGQACVEFFTLPILWVWGYIAAWLHLAPAMPTRTILHKQSGVLRPGEMCLVLGCPGSGCTTFLKAITNQRQNFAGVSGDVLYAGMDAEEMAKYYKGEVVYNEEDDIHIATLTVAQTLAFALSTKTPGSKGRLPGVSKKEFNAEVMDTLLRMLNIQHTKNTLVGNEFVRGVSGGERKRVSIAEMMTTRARVQAWDNSTRGLDASTALDFTRSLRVLTDVLGQTTFVSLYQAGEGIYELFDKVMVIDKGRQVFFGKPSEARAYFEGLGFEQRPRQSTADYLTGCTDPNERQPAPGRTREDIPDSPEALEAAYLASPAYRAIQEDLGEFRVKMQTEKEDQEAFRAAVLADKKKRASKKSPFTLGFTGQVKALTVRQFQMRMQDKFQLYTSFTLSWALALVIGGAFFQLPLTSAGAFTRGSVIFVAMISICLDAFGELPLQMIGRPILRKQTNYSLYRPSALTLANTFADIPFSAVRVLGYDIIAYFMAGLAPSAGGFFTFHIFNYIAFLCLQGFFRTFGLLCVNFDAAFRLISFFIPNLLEYTGYLLPVSSMHRWLFWIYYINPISYAWAGAMENEFMRISMTCDGNYIVPRNIGDITKYPDGLGPNQICTVFGSTPGDTLVNGRAYINATYDLNAADLWRRNFIVLVVFFFFFQLTQMIVVEFFPQHVKSISISIYAKPDEEAQERNEVLQSRKTEKNEKARRANKLELEDSKEAEYEKTPEKGADAFAHRRVFTWENLNYHVPVPGGTRRLLHDVNGYVRPGTLTALMGASGAGKTTCLDVLAQRKTIGVVTGDVLVDGRPLDSDFQRSTAYAEQMDVHEGTATVREALRFSAYLRQPAEVSKTEKDQYVEEIIELLELQDLTEALIFTLGVEAKKRLTIGVELASKPELLLFLDEPTSGLDSQSAWNLVRFLRKLADQGQAIVCTIHQPSSLLFESFDRLLLLERGGETVYFGDIGSDSSVLRDYFARHGAVCPPNINPAEYMLEAIGAGVTPRIGDKDWKDIWLESPEYQKALSEIAQLKEKGLARPVTEQKNKSTYATSFLFQVKTVVARNNLALWRSPDYVFSRLYVHIFISFFISLSFLQLGNSLRDLQYRVFAIFWLGILPMVVMTSIQPMYLANRRVFIREASSRIYSPYVFAIAQLIGEVPYSVLCAALYWVLMVWPMGFGHGSAGVGGNFFFLLIAFFMEMFGVSLGQLIAAISPSIQVAVLFNPFLGLILSTFCGVTIPYPTLAHFWKWLYQLNPYTRSLTALVSTELHGLAIKCQESEFNVFSPPSGQTCQQWAGDFVSTAGGYLNNPNATSNCQYCEYSVGDQFFTPLNIQYSNRWRDTGILVCFFVFNIIATIIASRFLRYAKR